MSVEALMDIVAEVPANAASGASDLTVRNSIVLFVTLGLLLGLFLLGVVLTALSRRRRLARREAAPTTANVDPWSESARRMGPVSRPPQGETGR